MFIPTSVPDDPATKASVLVVFDDPSLGGTSRSGMTRAIAWRRCISDVTVSSPRAIAAERVTALRNANVKVIPWVDALAMMVTLLDVTFPAPASRNRKWLGQVRAGPAATASLCLWNNVFARPHPDVPSQANSVENTLGAWASYQRRLQSLRGPLCPNIPNFQDFEFFRRPTLEERLRARQELGIGEGGHVIVRVGSPISDKWSDKYIDLASAARTSTMILVGCPDELDIRVRREHGRVIALHSLDQVAIRDVYWAGDVFAHYAERGETFGNVILESLACGLPVVYRDRRFRDNTPREFSSLPGFSLARTSRDWVELVCASTRHDDAESEGLSQYGLEFGASVLARIRDAVMFAGTAPSGLTARERCELILLDAYGSPSAQVSILDKLVISGLHNPVVRMVKDFRNRMISRRF